MAGGLRQPLAIDLLFAQSPGTHVVTSVVEAGFQHLGNLVVGQPVRGLDRHAGLDAGRHLAGRHRQQAIGIDLKGHADARRAGHHRRDAAQLEAGQRPAVADQFALALHDMEGHRGLAVLVRRELLRTGHRNRRIARNHLFGKTAHGLQPQRQRDHVEQQPVFVGAAVAGQRVGLLGGPERDDLVRIEVGQRLLPEEIGHRLLHMGHSRGAADHHHALDVFGAQSGVAQRLAHRREGLPDQVVGDRRELVAPDRQVHFLARSELADDRRLAGVRQQLLGLPRARQQAAQILGARRLDARLVEAPAEQPVIEVVATEGGVAVGREHLEHASRQPQDRDVEGAPTEIIDRVDALGGIVEAVGDRSRGGFVEQPQHVEPGESGGVLGGLTLGIVEVGRHGDHGAGQLAAEAGLGSLPKVLQDLGRDLDRALRPLHGAQPHHARGVDEVVRRGLDMGDVLETPPHEALDRGDGVARIDRLGLHRLAPDHDATVGQVAHDRGQHCPAVGIVEADTDAVADGGDQRIGGSEVDADRQPMLVRFGRHAGFGKLQQCHQDSSAARASSIS